LIPEDKVETLTITIRVAFKSGLIDRLTSLVSERTANEMGDLLKKSGSGYDTLKFSNMWQDGQLYPVYVLRMDEVESVSMILHDNPYGLDKPKRS